MDYILVIIVALSLASVCLSLVQTELKKCSAITEFNLEGCSCNCDFCSDPTIITCDKAGFTNKTIKTALTKLPPSVDVLRIKGDVLEELPLNIFGKADNQRKLEILDLSNNHIRRIHGKTFHHVKTVKHLILDNNDLYMADKVNMFSNFVNLTMLSLNDALDDEMEGGKHTVQLYQVVYSVAMTKLETVFLNDNNLKDGTLVILYYLPALKHLHLSRNQLEYVHLESSWLESVEMLNLTNNSISGLSEKATQALEKAHNLRKSSAQITIDITENPINCNCTARQFIEWLNKTEVNIYKKETLTCATPSVLKGRRILSLKPEEVEHCSISKSPTKTRGSIIAVGVIVGIIGVLFIIVMYMNRKGVKKRVAGAVHSVRMALGVYNHHGYTNVESHPISTVHL